MQQQQPPGIILTNELIGLISAIVVAIGAAVAAVIMWLDKRAKGIIADSTADLLKKVANLEVRIAALEDGQREARGYITDAIVLVAATPGGEDVIVALKKAQGILH